MRHSGSVVDIPGDLPKARRDGQKLGIRLRFPKPGIVIASGHSGGRLLWLLQNRTLSVQGRMLTDPTGKPMHVQSVNELVAFAAAVCSSGLQQRVKQQCKRRVE